MNAILSQPGLSLISHNVLFLRYFCLVDRQRKAPIMLGLSFFFNVQIDKMISALLFNSLKRITKQAQIYFQDKFELSFI
jgi:hypothetical protein